MFNLSPIKCVIKTDIPWVFPALGKRTPCWNRGKSCTQQHCQPRSAQCHPLPAAHTLPCPEGTQCGDTGQRAARLTLRPGLWLRRERHRPLQGCRSTSIPPSLPPFLSSFLQFCLSPFVSSFLFLLFSSLSFFFFFPSVEIN